MPTPEDSIRIALSAGTTPFDGTPLAPLAATLNASVRDEYPPALLAMLPPGAPRPLLPTCHRCGTPATLQWQRRATEIEVDRHWAAQEQHIRSIPDLFGHGNAEYVADRNQEVVKAVFGCDEHQVPDGTIVHAADCGGHGTCQCGDLIEHPQS